MNARRHRRLVLPVSGCSLAALALVLGVFALFPGCGLDTRGLANPDAGGADASPCTSAAQCDDGDPCTADTCTPDGVCASKPLPDGPVPAAQQVQGDCQRITCAGGTPGTEPDDTDVPAPTGMCDAASCSAGKPQHLIQPDGTACALAGAAGTCGNGACLVACHTATDCPSQGACQTSSCDGSKGACAYTNLPDGTPTPGMAQPVGDCHTRVCLAGADTNLVDDSDLPPAMGDCQDPQCVSGAPGYSFAKHQPPAVCSTFMGTQAGYCDGKGHCVACTQSNECPGTTNDCQHPTCTGDVCATTFTAAGTATTQNPKQVAGDCQKLVCDGMGNTSKVADDTDLPDDKDVCTTDVCTGGVPSHGVNAGVMCGGTTAMPEVCSTLGQCGCTLDADCPMHPPNTCGGGNPGKSGFCGCTKTTCATKGATCGSIPDACFGMLACDDMAKNGTETDVDCGGDPATCATRCAQGKICKAGTDCASGFCADGVCCNTACAGLACQACSAAAKGQGTNGVCGAVKAGPTNDPHNDCTAQAASTCGEVGGCNGAGACATWPNGTVCTATTCTSTSTQANASTCAGGTCTAPTPPTLACAPYLCTGSACATTCAMDTDCAPGNFCNASKCVPKLTQGTACTGDGVCAGGLCLGGFCCASACTGVHSGTCGATCAMTTGACQYPPALTNCAMGTCGGTTGRILSGLSVCDGEGTCKAVASHTCPTGKCGTSGCTACSGDTDCTPYGYCSSGACMPRGGPGAACTANDQCVSVKCNQAGNTKCM